MKQIVTIDFDIIMSPSIELYNDRIGPHEKDVEATMRKFPCLNGMTANLDVYRMLTHFINRVDFKNISFITQHREMRNFMSEFDEPIELVNIDHHHDIEYADKDADKTDNEHDGNWVKTYFQQNKIAKYCWINNVNSTPLSATMLEKFPHESFYISEEILETLNPDHLIICLSPEWVPPTYYALFTLWRELTVEV